MPEEERGRFLDHDRLPVDLNGVLQGEDTLDGLYVLGGELRPPSERRLARVQPDSGWEHPVEALPASGWVVEGQGVDRAADARGQHAVRRAEVDAERPHAGSASLATSQAS